MDAGALLVRATTCFRLEAGHGSPPSHQSPAPCRSQARFRALGGGGSCWRSCFPGCGNAGHRHDSRSRGWMSSIRGLRAGFVALISGFRIQCRSFHPCSLDFSGRTFPFHRRGSRFSACGIAFSLCGNAFSACGNRIFSQRNFFPSCACESAGRIIGGSAHGKFPETWGKRLSSRWNRSSRREGACGALISLPAALPRVTRGGICSPPGPSPDSPVAVRHDLSSPPGAGGSWSPGSWSSACPGRLP